MSVSNQEERRGDNWVPLYLDLDKSWGICDDSMWHIW